MNQRYQIIFGTVILIIIAVIAYVFWPTKTEAPSISTLVSETARAGLASTTLTQSATVSYTDQGFSPEVVEIAIGGTITFKNEATRDLWVASNDHPAHLLYPEFDAKKGYAPGSEYQFMFEKAGTWKYHDHLKASLGGTVIVK